MVSCESLIRQVNMTGSTVTLTPSFSVNTYVSPCFSPSLALSFADPPPSVFSCYCGVSLFILFFSDLFFSLLTLGSVSHRSFYHSVVLSSIKQGEHVIVLTTHSLCTTVPEALFSAEDPSGIGIQELKGTRRRIFNKQKRKRRAKADGKKVMWIFLRIQNKNQTRVCVAVRPPTGDRKCMCSDEPPRKFGGYYADQRFLPG